MLDGGAGEDLLNGGRGADKFIVRPDDDDDVIADFNRSEGDKIVLDDNATQVWFYNFSPGGSVPDFTVLYDAALNGDVYAILIGTHTLVSSDFESAGGSVTVTEITLAAPANPLSGGGQIAKCRRQKMFRRILIFWGKGRGTAWYSITPPILCNRMFM